MRIEIRDDNAFASIKPYALMRFLNVNGWKEARRIEGEAVVYSKTANAESTALVWAPLSDGFSDFASAVARLVRTVSEVENKSELLLLDELETAAVGDVITLRTYDPLDIHQHTIPLDDGVSLLSRARQMAYAAAQSTTDRKPVYRGRPSFETSRFLNNLRLGQTDRGSYMVKLISPIEEVEKPVHPEYVQISMPSIPQEVPFSRRAVTELVRGLKALRDAAQDNANRGKYYFGSFNRVVREGVSANLCEALADKNEELGDFTNKPIEIRVVWSYALESVDLSTEPILFDQQTVPYIRKAAQDFRAKNPETVKLQGWVKLFGRETRKPGPGQIRLFTVVNGKTRIVRVTLQKDDYELAQKAHNSGDLVSISGTLAKEGIYNVLKQPEGFGIIQESALSPDD